MDVWEDSLIKLLTRVSLVNCLAHQENLLTQLTQIVGHAIKLQLVVIHVRISVTLAMGVLCRNIYQEILVRIAIALV